MLFKVMRQALLTRDAQAMTVASDARRGMVVLGCCWGLSMAWMAYQAQSLLVACWDDAVAGPSTMELVLGVCLPAVVCMVTAWALWSGVRAYAEICALDAQATHIPASHRLPTPPASPGLHGDTDHTR